MHCHSLYSAAVHDKKEGKNLAIISNMALEYVLGHRHAAWDIHQTKWSLACILLLRLLDFTLTNKLQALMWGSMLQPCPSRS